MLFKSYFMEAQIEEETVEDSELKELEQLEELDKKDMN